MNIYTHIKSNNIHELSEVIPPSFNIVDNNNVEKMSNDKEKTVKIYTPNCESLGITDNKLLEEFFSKNKYPNLKEKRDLAINLKSSPLKIQTWFQNKRAKTKRKNEIKKIDTMSLLKKNRISQTVENVIAREMKKTSNPISDLHINEYSTKESLNNLVSLLNNSEKGKKCQKDAIKNKNPTFIYGLWCGLNLFFGNASPETINQFLNEYK
ncbi:Homeobox domain and Homeodomain-like-containing protein [Strongyloides ratti]|uniref:Homeobox domain and Homeodomain-like-containing protein n=1 Tax=Strongyloides ratti TaxID=34506 RepID=A0A090L6D3_STRRB|nr:Homeobox domain and Homeodomain-like-containing protein [Strongyloides ratti]CEF63069.1 Homeobox domain and Homeodomain-like-containing protein [Strongyloides ratti]